MNFFSFIKKYQLILFLSFIVVTMLVLKLIFGSSNNNQSNISPTPTLIKLPTPTIENRYKIEEEFDINDNYPLAQILPYSTKDFTVTRYVDYQTIEVKLINKDKTFVEKEVRAWIKENGPESNSHKIVWVE